MTRPRIRHRLTPQTSLREALSDQQLLGDVLSGPSWQAWRVLLTASMGEQLTDDERQLFKQLTGRDREPLQRVEEFVGVIGRRGGKSRSISVLATYLAGLCRHPTLVPGERGIVLIVAPDMQQSDIVLDYVDANFRHSPVLRNLIENRTQRELRLTNNITIEVRASDFRRLRGPTYIAAIGDEVAFWLNEKSSNPDTEILNAVRPGLATTNGSLFLISSPYARRGELWRLYDRHFGANGDPAILVAQGSSRTFNPSLSQSIVDRAVERDAASAAAEYGAQFRTDIENFVSIEAVRACVSSGTYERAPQAGVVYHGFVDPSGGSQDSMTLAISHNVTTKQTIVLDAVREQRPPFSPEQVVNEFATLLKSYRVSKVIGDRYAGVWPVEMFGKCSVIYEQSAKPKSDLYVDLLPLINSARIDLLDHPRLLSQLTALERRVARGGRDSIDHGPGQHDDVANAVAGAASISVSKYGAYDPTFKGWNDADDPTDRDGAKAWRAARLAAYLNSGGRVIL
jgi:hypothetical protein